jgi:hypothetical protein
MTDLARLAADDLLLDGHRLDVELAAAITDAELERTMQGASTVTLELAREPGWALLRNQELLGRRRLDTGVQLMLDDLPWTVSEIEKTEDGAQVVSYDAAVAELKRRHGHEKASRGELTRIGFMASLCRKAGVDVVAPERDVLRPIADLSAEDQRALRDARQNRRRQDSQRGRRSRGALEHADLKVGHGDVDAEQLRNMRTVLGVLDAEDAKPKVRLACVMAAIGEGAFRRSSRNPDSNAEGVFQLLPSTQRNLGLDPRDTEACAKQFLHGGFASAGGAIALHREHPDWDAAMIASYVESGTGDYVSHYSASRGEARTILAAWSPDDSDPFAQRTGTADRAFVERAEYQVEPGENWWETLQRLADEITIRCFAVGGRVWIASDLWLIRQTPVLALREGAGGVESLRWLWTRGNRIDEMTAVVRGAKRIELPGSVMLVHGEGAGDGPWLVRKANRPLRDDTGLVTYTLGQPQQPKPEPASTVHTEPGEPAADASGAGGRTGRVTVAAGANRDGVPLRDPVMFFLRRMAGATSERVHVTTGSNHNQFVKDSHNQSDHWTGDAADLGLGGDARSNPDVGRRGDKLCVAALRVLGHSYGEARQMAAAGGVFEGTWKGHRVQVLWRTLTGGNHFNHVHVGVR